MKRQSFFHLYLDLSCMMNVKVATCCSLFVLLMFTVVCESWINTGKRDFSLRLKVTTYGDFAFK